MRACPRAVREGRIECNRPATASAVPAMNDVNSHPAAPVAGDARRPADTAGRAHAPARRRSPMRTWRDYGWAAAATAAATAVAWPLYHGFHLPHQARSPLL